MNLNFPFSLHSSYRAPFPGLIKGDSSPPLFPLFFLFVLYLLFLFFSFFLFLPLHWTMVCIILLSNVYPLVVVVFRLREMIWICKNCRLLLCMKHRRITFRASFDGEWVRALLSLWHLCVLHTLLLRWCIFFGWHLCVLHTSVTHHPYGIWYDGNEDACHD